MITPIIGQRVNVLYVGLGEAHSSDLCCGDTTVTQVKSNGTFRLANGYEFRADGTGLAKNNACAVRGPACCLHNDVTLTVAERAEHYADYRAVRGDNRELAKAEFLSWPRRSWEA